MVHDVEDLRAELQHPVFPKLCVFRDREIHVPESRTKDAIAAQVANALGIRRVGKRSRIQIASGRIPIREHEWLTGNNIRPLIAAEARESRCGDVDRTPRLHSDYGVELPSRAQGFADRMQCRQLIIHCGGPTVARVKDGWTFLGLQVSGELRKRDERKNKKEYVG